MSEGKHTPWKAGIPERTDTDWFVCSIRDARNGLIAVVHASTKEDCQRDANLIAASVNQRPVLLEALKEAAEELEEEAITCEEDKYFTRAKNLRQVASKARAAIAQAEKGAVE